MNTTNQTPKYTVACIEAADQGVFASSCIDRFAIKQDGVHLFTVAFNYATDENGSVGATVQSMAELHPCILPGIMNGIHLVGVLHNWLCEQQDRFEDTPFFGDMFFDTVGAIELEIDFQAMRDAAVAV